MDEDENVEELEELEEVEEVSEDNSQEDNAYLLQWAVDLLNNEISPEILELKKLILKRVATESDIKPSRIPAPLNITEIGGYFNLMMKLRREEEEKQQQRLSEMLTQTLSSILGLPMQAPN